MAALPPEPLEYRSLALQPLFAVQNGLPQRVSSVLAPHFVLAQYQSIARFRPSPTRNAGS